MGGAVGGKLKKDIVIIKLFQEHFVLKHRKLSHFSEMQNYALMHLEGLKG